MSSTNRGRRRNPLDYYVTKPADIADFLRAFQEDMPKTFPGYSPVYILDPCAGGDSVNPMSYPEALKMVPFRFCAEPVTIDIRGNSKAAYCRDFLAMTTEEIADISKPDLILTNPPFVLALQFINKSLDIIRPGGFVIMLCRLNFLGSQLRKTFWQSKMPCYIYTHSKRLGFWPENPSPEAQAWHKENDLDVRPGATDSTEYGHFVWQKDNYPRFAQLRVI